MRPKSLESKLRSCTHDLAMRARAQRPVHALRLPATVTAVVVVAAVALLSSAAPAATARDPRAATLHAGASTGRPLHVLAAVIKSHGQLGAMKGTLRALLQRGHNVTLCIDEEMWSSAQQIAAGLDPAHGADGHFALMSRGFTTSKADDEHFRKAGTDAGMTDALQILISQNEGIGSTLVAAQRAWLEAQERRGEQPAPGPPGGTAAARAGVTSNPAKWPAAASLSAGVLADMAPADVVVCDAATTSCFAAGEAMGVPVVRHSFLDENAFVTAPGHIDEAPSIASPLREPLGAPQSVLARLANDVAQRAATLFVARRDMSVNNERVSLGIAPGWFLGHSRLDATVLGNVHGLLASVWHPPIINVVGATTMSATDTGNTVDNLSSDLRAWLDSADDDTGVVYAALGTIIRPKPQVIASLFEGLASLTVGADRRVPRVLWALHETQWDSLPMPIEDGAWPSHIRVVAFAPQRAVLAHPAVR